MILPQWAFWMALAVMLVGLVGALLPGIPGVGLIWLTVLVYAIAEDFTLIDPLTMGVFTVLAVIGVTADIWVSQAGGRVGGASWQALIAGMVLGAVGLVLGLFVGVVGAIPGAILGSLAGILLVERRRLQNWEGAARAGIGWLIGYFLSAVVELSLSLIMIFLFIWQVLRG